MTAPLSWITRTLDRLVAKKHSLYIHPKISATGGHSGNGQVATFQLDAGRWVVLAKATASGNRDNDGPANCALTIYTTLNGKQVSDESYASPMPEVGETMMSMLPLNLDQPAQITVNAEWISRGAQFNHIVVTAIRDMAI